MAGKDGGKDIIRIQRQDFNVKEMLGEMSSSARFGAVASFVGKVRREKGIRGIEVEAYEEMAVDQLKKLASAAKKRFGAGRVFIIHRTGKLKLGENIVLVSVGSGHRKEAFGACEWLIDELKKVAPIWKKDIPMKEG